MDCHVSELWWFKMSLAADNFASRQFIALNDGLEDWINLWSGMGFAIFSSMEEERLEVD
jgi:hypothetical protein